MHGRGRLLIVMALALVPLAGCTPARTESAAAGAEAPPASPRPTTSRPSTTSPVSPTATTSTTTATTTTASTTTDGAPPSVPASTLPAPAVRSGADASLDAGVGEPIAISIPAIGVESLLLAAGTLDDGSIDVPRDPSTAAWFTGGPRPGDRGPAVIVGHVDSKRGPCVFWRLHELPVGAVVTVETTTGPVEFVVESVEQYPKDQFPTHDVYGAVPRPALRLVTCGGSFDRSIGHYRDNIVAYLISPVA
jgi:hypothetical protein